MTHDTSHSEPTRKDVLDIADYLGCNGDELWSEISKLLLRQDTYARIDENEWTSNKLTQDVSLPAVPLRIHYMLNERLADLKRTATNERETNA